MYVISFWILESNHVKRFLSSYIKHEATRLLLSLADIYKTAKMVVHIQCVKENIPINKDDLITPFCPLNKHKRNKLSTKSWVRIYGLCLCLLNYKSLVNKSLMVHKDIDKLSKLTTILLNGNNQQNYDVAIWRFWPTTNEYYQFQKYMINNELSIFLEKTFILVKIYF